MSAPAPADGLAVAVAVAAETAGAATIRARGDGLARALAGRIAYDRFNIGLLDLDAYVFHDAYVTGTNVAGRATGHLRTLDGTVVEAGIRAGGGIAFGDADRDRWLARFPRFGPVLDSGIRAMMAAPVRHDGTVIASLVLASRDPAAYGPEHLALLNRIGEAAAGQIAALAGEREGTP